jgi:predicted ATPase
MYILNLALRNWMNFKNAQTELGTRAFIIGPNASGKSNLLDSLRFLRELASEGLHPAVTKRGGVSSIRCLSATIDHLGEACKKYAVDLHAYVLMKT